MHEPAKRMRGDDFLSDRDRGAVDRHIVDAEGRALMRQAAARKQVQRGGGASHSGWARLVVTSLSPACQRRVNAGIEKSALLAASSAGFPSWTRCRIVIVALLASARHLRISGLLCNAAGTRSPNSAIMRRRSWWRRNAAISRAERLMPPRAPGTGS